MGERGRDLFSNLDLLVKMQAPLYSFLEDMPYFVTTAPESIKNPRNINGDFPALDSEERIEYSYTDVFSGYLDDDMITTIMPFNPDLRIFSHLKEKNGRTYKANFHNHAIKIFEGIQRRDDPLRYFIFRKYSDTKPSDIVEEVYKAPNLIRAVGLRLAAYLKYIEKYPYKNAKDGAREYKTIGKNHVELVPDYELEYLTELFKGCPDGSKICSAIGALDYDTSSLLEIKGLLIENPNVAKRLYEIQPTTRKRADTHEIMELAKILSAYGPSIEKFAAKLDQIAEASMLIEELLQISIGLGAYGMYSSGHTANILNISNIEQALENRILTFEDSIIESYIQNTCPINNSHTTSEKDILHGLSQAPTDKTPLSIQELSGLIRTQFPLYLLLYAKEGGAAKDMKTYGKKASATSGNDQGDHRIYPEPSEEGSIKIPINNNRLLIKEQVASNSKPIESIEDVFSVYNYITISSDAAQRTPFKEIFLQLPFGLGLDEEQYIEKEYDILKSHVSSSGNIPPNFIKKVLLREAYRHIKRISEAGTQAGIQPQLDRAIRVASYYSYIRSPASKRDNVLNTLSFTDMLNLEELSISVMDLRKYQTSDIKAYNSPIGRYFMSIEQAAKELYDTILNRISATSIMQNMAFISDASQCAIMMHRMHSSQDPDIEQNIADAYTAFTATFNSRVDIHASRNRNHEYEMIIKQTRMDATTSLDILKKNILQALKESLACGLNINLIKKKSAYGGTLDKTSRMLVKTLDEYTLDTVLTEKTPLSDHDAELMRSTRKIYSEIVSEYDDSINLLRESRPALSMIQGVLKSAYTIYKHPLSTTLALVQIDSMLNRRGLEIIKIKA